MADSELTDAIVKLPWLERIAAVGLLLLAAGFGLLFIVSEDWLVMLGSAVCGIGCLFSLRVLPGMRAWMAQFTGGPHGGS